MRGLLLVLWMIISIAWIGFVGWTALQSWPQLSLDMGNDPGTLAELRNAQTMHALRYGAVALLAPIVLLIAGRWLAGGRG